MKPVFRNLAGTKPATPRSSIETAKKSISVAGTRRKRSPRIAAYRRYIAELTSEPTPVVAKRDASTAVVTLADLAADLRLDSGYINRIARHYFPDFRLRANL